MHQPHRTHISVQEAANMLGESRWTIQRRVRKGELSAELIGGALILDRAEVVKLAAEVAREAAAKADHIANAIAEPATR